MTPRLKTVLGLAVASIALVIPLTGCTVPSVTPSAPASSAGGGSGGGGSDAIEFSLLEEKTAPAFASDPNCGYGQWNENSTGVDEEFRPAVKFFRQFDCYKTKGDAGGIPERLQQSIFVEFNDEASAKKYAEGEQALYSSLLAGPTVVVAGTGLESVDMNAYLEDLKSSCGCGELLAAGG